MNLISNSLLLFIICTKVGAIVPTSTAAGGAIVGGIDPPIPIPDPPTPIDPDIPVDPDVPIPDPDDYQDPTDP